MADEADDLYALPLEEFTQARNAREALEDPSIKELKKPSVSAWARTSWRGSGEVDVRRLLRAGRLERAQRGIVGGGDQNAFAEAQQRSGTRSAGSRPRRRSCSRSPVIPRRTPRSSGSPRHCTLRLRPKRDGRPCAAVA